MKISSNLNSKYPQKSQDGRIKYIDTILLSFEYCKFGSIFDCKLTDIIGCSDDIIEQVTITRTYFKQLMSAINSCHKAGIIHRDLKPGNLLIDSKFQLKVGDFGMCKILDIIDESDESVINDKTRKMGTRGWMAPEIVIGRKYNQSCDIFSAGVILFYLCFGTKPFGNASIQDKTYQLVIQQKFDQFWRLHNIATVTPKSPVSGTSKDYHNDLDVTLMSSNVVINDEKIGIELETKESSDNNDDIKIIEEMINEKTKSLKMDKLFKKSSLLS